jgi:segregation and condensation protein B
METEDQDPSPPTVEEEERRQLLPREGSEEDLGPDPSPAEAAPAQNELERDLEPRAARAVIESLLLAAPTPLTLAMLREATDFPTAVLRDELEALGATYCEGAGGIVLTETAGGFQLRTAPSSAPYVRRLLRARPQRLTRASLETLALVAYRQPVTRAEIEDVRGVDCGAVIKALLERRLLKILGKKEELGRPLIYGTTREFLELFGFNDLAGLPTLREFQELSDEHRARVEQEDAKPEPVSPRPEPEHGAGGGQLESSEVEGQDALDYLEAAMAEAEARAQRVGEQLATEEAPLQPEERTVDG